MLITIHGLDEYYLHLNKFINIVQHCLMGFAVIVNGKEIFLLFFFVLLKSKRNIPVDFFFFKF